MSMAFERNLGQECLLKQVSVNVKV